jgi:Ca2+-transporting ATPase
MILLLLVVGIIYSIWGKLEDAITIFVIITILVFMEVYVEFKAKKSINALKKLTEPNITVLRDSSFKEVPVAELVPGDIIALKTGQRIPADARLIESYGLMANESSLTGESILVEKDANILVKEDSQLSERKNMVFTGSIIAKGRGKAVITTTGMKTELGKIAKLVQEAKIERTPLQKLMKELVKWMVWVALFFSILIPIIGILRGNPWKEMILTGLALSFATIPEELPIVITMVLALGAFALSKNNALVKRLDAAETLGSVTVICSDKTGTLTENKMEISKIFINDELKEFDKSDKRAIPLLEAAVVCNDVLVKDHNIFVGDTTLIAGLNAAISAGLEIEKVKKKYGKQINEFSFDSERKLMSTVYFNKNSGYVFTTGAPEMLLKKCNKILVNGRERTIIAKDRKMISEAIEEMSKNSLRVISYAYKTIRNEKIAQKEGESELIFVGMFGLIDPPRQDVWKAVAECHSAGIRVIMITGDHVDTAKSIAKQVGIENGAIMSGQEIDKVSDEMLSHIIQKISVFARVSPEHKLRIVNALKKNNEIVAVTGDGINDAPALSNAHIGIAMGDTGTDVAREASNMILIDDNFFTISKAVKEGRIIFDNLKKGIRYYLSCKLALIVIFLLPVLIGVSLPFAPVQIILLELFMDVAASIGFAVEPAESDIMNRKPRNTKEKFLNNKMISSIAISAICLITAVLFVYFWSMYHGASVPKAQTLAFATWIFGHVFLAINMRSEREPLYELGLFSNEVIVIWAASAITLIIVAVNIPYLQEVLKTTALTIYEFLFVIVVSFVATFWREAVKLIRYVKVKA